MLKVDGRVYRILQGTVAPKGTRGIALFIVPKVKLSWVELTITMMADPKTLMQLGEDLLSFLKYATCIMLK